MQPVDTNVISEAAAPFSKKNDVDIIVFCGSPGAGKSSFYWRHLQPLGYARVNQDILKTVRILLQYSTRPCVQQPRSVE